MRNITARIGANLVWLVLFSVAVVLGAFLSFVSGVLFDDSYPISVPMPEAGGVLPAQQVTLLGQAVGQVENVVVTEDGVLLELSIQGDQQVPREPIVQVLRRSPIGEQAVDFQPTGPDWEPAEQGARIEPVEAITPPKVPVLLEETVKLFQAIDRDDFATVIREAAVALEGTGPILKSLNQRAVEVQQVLADGIPQFERLIDSSTPILSELRDHRDALAESFTNAAELTEIFAEQRPTVSALIDNGTVAVEQADALIRNERANLECLMRDFIDFNQMMLGPSTAVGLPQRFYDSKLEEFSRALALNRRFFQEGFFIIGQPDPDTGVGWTRIKFEGPDKPQGGQAYPQRRPTPVTKPGAACQTEAFGTGVNAVRQPDHMPAHFTVPPPGIDFAPLVAGSGGQEITPPSSGGTGTDGTGADRPGLPATGGGLMLLGLVCIGAAGLAARRS